LEGKLIENRDDKLISDTPHLKEQSRRHYLDMLPV